MIQRLFRYPFLPFGLFLILFACDAKPKPVPRKPVDFENIRPKPALIPILKDSLGDTTQSELTIFEHDSLKMHFDSLVVMDDLHFLNRFTEINRKKNSSSKEKKHWTYWRLYQKKKVIELRKWDFKDSITRSNAFYNWIDNYGEDRLSFRPFESIVLSHQYVLVLVNSSSIVAVESSTKIDKAKWEMYQKVSSPKDTTRMEIYQTPKKPCVWFVKDEHGKFTPYKPEDEPLR